MSLLKTQTDETLDVNPTTTLNEQQLRLAKVNQLEVGTEFEMTCKAVVVEAQEVDGDQGPETTAVLELSRITLEGVGEPPTPIQRLYPSMKK